MAKRFTATEKWIDPWFCELGALDKLFWVYLLDNCDHAGIWQVNWPLVKFHIKDFVFKKEVFNGRILELKEQKWFIPKFIVFQYGELNPENRAHLSVIHILKKEGAYKGLKCPSEGDKDKDMDKDNIKDKDNTTEVGGLLLKNRFLVDLKSTYKMLNVDSEILACISWHKNKGTKVKSWDRAITNWLKISYEKTGVVGFEKAESKLKPKDPNCTFCKGIGFIYNQSKSANEICQCRLKG